MPSPPATEGSRLKAHGGHIQALSLCLESSCREWTTGETRMSQGGSGTERSLASVANPRGDSDAARHCCVRTFSLDWLTVRESV